MSGSLDLQHVNVKFFLKDANAIDLEDAINLFHSWTQDQRLDDLLIDVADYRHVPSGPGVILIGHNAHYSFDNAEGQMGILYNRKTAVDGDATEQIRKAFEVNKQVCQLIASAETFQGKFAVATDRVQVLINDRLLGVNDEEGFNRLLPSLTAALVATFGEQDYSIEQASDPRKRLSVTVKVPQGFEI